MICALVLGTLSPNNGDMHVGNFNNFGNQCPSFFDLDMFMDKASGFHYFSNQKVKINWREFLSPNLRQQVKTTKNLMLIFCLDSIITSKSYF